MDQREWHTRLRTTAAGMSEYELQMLLEIAMRELASRPGGNLINVDRTVKRIMRHMVLENRERRS
jgi:hypothetical protein